MAKKKKAETVSMQEEVEKAWDPDHYTKWAIQPNEYSIANKLGACEYAIIKYVTRWRDRGGLKDLIKAKHYIDFLIRDYHGEYTREALAKKWLKELNGGDK